MLESFVCHRHEDGRVTADRFPQHIAISSGLLDEGMPDLMRIDGDHVTFTLANGTARYRRIQTGEYQSEFERVYLEEK